MDGIINVLKPKDMTSFDVVACIRRIACMKKVGHTGTLDPNAVGVLPICIGKATKLADEITGKDKEYIAEIKLGITTNTGDGDGEITSENSYPNFINKDKFEYEFKNVLRKFIGDIEQIPPMHSAIKINGQKLYTLARQGIEVERKPRKIKIYNIELIDFNLEKGTALIKVACSKGTYIRTLCEDIGTEIGCGAYMSFLIRTRTGEFRLQDAKTLEEIQDDIEKCVIPLDKIKEEEQK